MSNLIIKIGDDALDLSTGETIAITKQAAKVGDFSTVLADGTNEVTVPLTANNRLIMDNAHLMQSDSAKPYARLDATLIQEGYETIQDGYAIVKSSEDNFSLQVVGGNASFFDRIKDLNLRELPLGEFDHFWTNANVFALRNESEGLIYAVFEQSLDATTMRTYGTNLYAVATEMLLPSFYIKTLVEKIFAAQGYAFNTDLIGEDIYEKAVVFRGAIPNRGTDMSYHDCTVTSTLDYPIVTPAAAAESFPFAAITGTSAYVNSPEFLDGIENFGKVYLTDNCRVKADFVFYIDSPFPSVEILLNVWYSTLNGEVNFQTQSTIFPSGTGTYTASFEVDCSDLNGEIYFITRLDASLTGAPYVQVLTGSYYTVEAIGLLDNSPLTTSWPYNYVTGALPVPDMKQGEFLKELAKMYQWVFDTDERTHTVTARRFDNIKERIPQAIDLSNKIDARKIKTTYGIDGFAQTNALRYKEDDVTKYDAVGYINVSDTTLNASKDYVKMSQFAASSTRLRFDTVNAPYVPIFEGLLPTNGMTDRIFLVRRVTPFPYNVNFNRDTESPANHPTDDLTFAYFAEAGNTDSLDFPTLISRFYQTIIDMTDRGKTVDANVNLNISDVINYDPLTPVYISSLGNYFYWEKLNNYVKDKLTKCKFVKI